jgi:HEAT repeat protein
MAFERYFDLFREDETVEHGLRNIYQGIVRALTVNESKPYKLAPLLIEHFYKVGDNHVRWVIGNALFYLANRSDLDDMLAIAKEKSYGRSRQMVVDALGWIGKNREDVVDDLIALLDDEDVVVFAISALGKLKAAKSRPRLEGLLDHELPLARRTTKAALRKIDRVQ